MIALDTLAAYFVQLARSEKEKSKRREFFTKVGCASVCGVCKACVCSVYVCLSVSACVCGTDLCVCLCVVHFSDTHAHMHTRRRTNSVHVTVCLCVACVVRIWTLLHPYMGIQPMTVSVTFQF